ALKAGVKLTHIDGHKHVHVIPSVLRAICRIAPEYGIHAVRPVIEKTPRLARMAARHARDGRAVLKQFFFGKIASIVWKVSNASTAKHLAGPDRLYGITQTGFLDLPAFTDIIRNLKAGVNELMCHPGFIDEQLKKTPTRLLWQREREWKLL